MSRLSHQSKIYIADVDALSCMAERLAGQLKAGDVIALDGPLGAGKTALVQALCKALGTADSAASPTFVLMHEYAGARFPVVHADLYRLGPEKADSLSEELLGIIDDGRALVLVEWAEYGPFLDPVTSIRIGLDYAPEADHPDRRALAFSADRPLELGV